MNVRPTPVEKLVHRIEEHVEEWRKEQAARQAEVEAEMDEWWTEAAEREKRLAMTVSQEEKEKHSVEEATKKHMIAFVVHTEGAGEALENFAGERARLVSIVPGNRDYKGTPGFKGSWLIFEDAGQPEDGSE